MVDIYIYIYMLVRLIYACQFLHFYSKPSWEIPSRLVEKNSRSFLWTLSRPRMPCTMMRMPKRQKPQDFVVFQKLPPLVLCRLIMIDISNYQMFFFVCIVALDPTKLEHGLQHTAAWGKRSCKRHLKEEPLLRERLSALPTVIGWLVRWVLRFVGVPLLHSGTQ